MMVRYSAVPSLVCGGAPGAIQEVTFSFHLPAIFAIFWCSGPGAAAFMYFSINACSSTIPSRLLQSIASFAYSSAAIRLPRCSSSSALKRQQVEILQLRDIQHFLTKVM